MVERFVCRFGMERYDDARAEVPSSGWCLRFWLQFLLLTLLDPPTDVFTPLQLQLLELQDYKSFSLSLFVQAFGSSWSAGSL